MMLLLWSLRIFWADVLQICRAYGAGLRQTVRPIPPLVWPQTRRAWLLLLCIFLIVLLGRLAKASQAGAVFRPAGRKTAAHAETSSPSIRLGVMRSPACFARAH